MSNQNIPVFTTSRSVAISKLQSAVHETVRHTLSNTLLNASEEEIQQQLTDHSMVLGVNMFAAYHNGSDIDLSRETVESYITSGTNWSTMHPIIHAYISKQVFDKLKEIQGQPVEIDINGPLAGFPDSDYTYEQWAVAAKNFLLYGNPYPGPYVRVNDHGGPESDFSVFEIPADSKILLLGDFGTGLDDATSMLIAVLKNLYPNFIIHLGDIYYSGTEAECDAYCNVFRKAFEVSGYAVPVFSLPGNHEYISGGDGFFNKVLNLNPMILGEDTKYRQQASYFSLRTADGHWQFLGMDTGYNSVRTHTWSLSSAYSPWLEFGEAAWHQNKIENWNGRNILLSHHQLFSAFDRINDGDDVHYQSRQSSHIDNAVLNYLNYNLFPFVYKYAEKIATWFWGHEHNLNIFDSIGILAPRLIGNSGYEEYEEEVAPPGITHATGSPYNINNKVRVGTTSIEYRNKFYDGTYKFLNHTCAFIQLNKDKAAIQYFQYPITSISRGFKHLDPNQPLTYLYHEEI